VILSHSTEMTGTAKLLKLFAGSGLSDFASDKYQFRIRRELLDSWVTVSYLLK